MSTLTQIPPEVEAPPLSAEQIRCAPSNLADWFMRSAALIGNETQDVILVAHAVKAAAERDPVRFCAELVTAIVTELPEFAAENTRNPVTGQCLECNGEPREWCGFCGTVGPNYMGRDEL